MLIKNIRNRFRLERKNKAIKNKILEDVRALYENDEENSYRPTKTKGAFNNYIEFESNDGRYKKLSLAEYLHEI